MEPTSVRFAHAVRRLAATARAEGLRPPSFRSPPKAKGVNRTIRRRGEGDTIVAVTVRGRPWAAVQADLVEGVLVANSLAGPAADHIRSLLWAAVGGDEPEGAAA